MTNPPGSFIWYELLTGDPAAAAEFYGTVVGWRTHGFEGAPVEAYTLFQAPGGVDVAGLMALPDGAPGPVWLAYIGVDDVDAATESATRAGATVQMAPQSLPGVGRLAMLADPQGAAFYLMRGDSPEDSHSFQPITPGHAGWHELHTKGWEAARDFYHGQFGWQTSSEMDMGPMGKYSIFSIAGTDAGAIFNSPDVPRPIWLVYFNVADLDSAAGRITEIGGTILHGPMDVPDGQRIVQARDPQGAMFALVGPGTGAPS